MITAAVFLGYLAVAVTYIRAEKPSALTLAGGIGTLFALLAFQLVHSFPRFVPTLTRYWPLTLAAQVFLTYAPFEVFGHAWIGIPSFLAGTLLLLLPARFGWPAFAGVVVLSNVLMTDGGFSWSDSFYISVATCTNGLVVYGLSRLTDMVAEVHRSRAELARLAVAQERLRFARDLHDLLGYSLSAITLKCELAYRLVPAQSALAQAELTEILQTARQALADVRAVARGYRDMSLEAEVEDARSMLTTLGIRTRVRLDHGPLPQKVETVLATVLREGLTNMLRHSKVEQCRIEAVGQGGLIRFCLENDGTARVPEPRDREQGNGGGGIGNLTTRVGALGGTLSAGHDTDGWFRLRAEIDLAAVPTQTADDPVLSGAGAGAGAQSG
ncbi:sensor histidine kinase [Kitasatospora sp. NPDC008050]|uniref:sensor histidine kinase n=1 Tax=Kitasatospora sp. NPDC008050 TaxID=3364021 RepID=UPI0036EF79D7